MYEYRKLPPEQRADLVRRRLAHGLPPHSPPHPVRDQPSYLVTVACYEHACYMSSPMRREQLLEALTTHFIDRGIEILAWVVLPNHYHVLLGVPDFNALGDVLRLVHGAWARRWNLEDGTSGRKVWYRYSDRAIRADRHYYTTLNYIHYNPVKHGWAGSPYAWRESSVHQYLGSFGRQWLRDLWVRHPVADYGHGWDDLGRTGVVNEH